MNAFVLIAKRYSTVTAYLEPKRRSVREDKLEIDQALYLEQKFAEMKDKIKCYKLSAKIETGKLYLGTLPQ